MGALLSLTHQQAADQRAGADDQLVLVGAGGEDDAVHDGRVDLVALERVKHAPAGVQAAHAVRVQQQHDGVRGLERAQHLLALGAVQLHRHAHAALQEHARARAQPAIRLPCRNSSRCPRRIVTRAKLPAAAACL